jgi:hypothetical protein
MYFNNDISFFIFDSGHVTPPDMEKKKRQKGYAEYFFENYHPDYREYERDVFVSGNTRGCFSTDISSFFEIDDENMQVIYDPVISVKVDIGLHFSLYLLFKVYNESNGIVDDVTFDLLGFNLLADEINQKKLEDGEVFFDIYYSSPSSDGLSVFVSSDDLVFLENTIYMDIHFNAIKYQVCLCMSGKEFLYGS